MCCTNWLKVKSWFFYAQRKREKEEKRITHIKRKEQAKKENTNRENLLAFGLYHPDRSVCLLMPAPLLSKVCEKCTAFTFMYLNRIHFVSKELSTKKLRAKRNPNECSHTEPKKRSAARDGWMGAFIFPIQKDQNKRTQTVCKSECD